MKTETHSRNKGKPKNEDNPNDHDNPENEDGLKKEGDPKNGDFLKNWDNPKNKEDLNNEGVCRHWYTLFGQSGSLCPYKSLFLSVVRPPVIVSL